MKFYTDRIISRLEQLKNEVANTDTTDFYDRLRAFKEYCEQTSIIASCLFQLPKASYNFHVQEKLPAGDAGYSARWDAIRQIVEEYVNEPSLIPMQGVPTTSPNLRSFVTSVCNYLIHQLDNSGTVLHLLIRYKGWVEWFEAEQLYKDYQVGGEEVLNKNLRRFLFEGGVDYPFSEPHSPGGRADIVAALETDDPLVLESKVWDSDNSYKENRVRDGLRQVMDYAAKYRKDKGYLVVFNCDPIPLTFIGDTNPGEWPARLQVDRTYYFIDINIAQPSLPVSQQDKGKPVKRNKVNLRDLWDKLKDA